MLLSTLNGYLRGMGGRLRLVAEFDGRPKVEIAGSASVAGPSVAPRKAAASERPGRRRRAAP